MGSKEENYYDYIALLIKYFEKNDNIGIGLNFGVYSNETRKYEYPLPQLLRSKYLNKDYLQLILNLFVECKSGIKKEIYDETIEICKNNDNMKEYQSMIQETYSTIKNFEIPNVKNYDALVGYV